MRRSFVRIGISRFHNVYSGTVTDVQESSYTLLTPEGQSLPVELTPGTQFPLGHDIKAGDDILVLGGLRRGSVRAFGVRKIKDSLN